MPPKPSPTAGNPTTRRTLPHRPAADEQPDIEYVSLRSGKDLSASWPGLCASLASGLLVVLPSIALLPHSPPYREGDPLLHATVLMWQWTGWALLLPVWLALLAHNLHRQRSTAVAGRPPRGRAATALVGAGLVLPLLAVLYVELLLPSWMGQPFPNGFLRLCLDWCDSGPFGPCHRAIANDTADGTPAARAANAVSFFRTNVFGAAPAVRAHMAPDNVSVRVGFAGLKEECEVELPLLSPGGKTVLLSMGQPSGCASS